MASEAILGQTITSNLCCSLGIVTVLLNHFTSARMEISVHWQFQGPGKLHEGATHASWSEFCLVFSFIVFQPMLADNVWPPCSKSARSQVSATLFLCPDHNIRAGMDLYRQYAGLLPASGTATFSQNNGPTVT